MPGAAISVRGLPNSSLTRPENRHVDGMTVGVATAVPEA
jgi:hypothetical protein